MPGRKRKEHPPKNCEVCGKPIEPRIYYRADGKLHHIFMPKKYCSIQCTGMAMHLRQLDKTPGRYKDKSGYMILGGGKRGVYRQPEHRAVMEAMVGRKLEDHETVHHKNGIRDDNRPENLELWSGRHGRGHKIEPEELDIWSGSIPKYQFDALQGE